MSYEYYAQYAYNLSLKGRPDVALNYLNKGATLAKNKSRYYFDKALMWGYMQPLGARDSVYFYLDKAVLHDSLNAYYYAARAKFYNEDTLNDKALNDLNKSVFLDPKDTSYKNLRGEVKIFFKDYKSAYEDLKILALINRYNPVVRTNKAYCLVKLNKIKECFAELEVAIKINPNIGKIYSVRAIAKEKSGDHNGAIEDLKKGASLGDKECIEYMKQYDEYQKTHKQS
jgi:predicted Zn-dependent protease